MALPTIRKLVILGTGLIGGSFALDLRRAGQVQHVVGVGRQLENLDRAKQLGVVDSISQNAAEAVVDADVVLLACPVGQMPLVMQSIASTLPKHCLVTDAGSTKQDVVSFFRTYLPNHLGNCVPAHPIAGAELSGAAAARYGLYLGKNVILTPLPETSALSVQMIGDLWKSCGAQLISMQAAEHDSIFASVSHLPHLLAFAYMNHVLDRSDSARALSLAGSGFRDFSRIAASHPDMWRDIALSNRDALLAELKGFSQQVEKLITQLEGGDVASLHEYFMRSSVARNQWGKH